MARIEAIRKRKAELQPGSLRYFLEDDAWPAGGDSSPQAQQNEEPSAASAGEPEPPLDEVDHLLAEELQKYVQRHESRDGEVEPDAGPPGWDRDDEADGRPRRDANAA